MGQTDGESLGMWELPKAQPKGPRIWQEFGLYLRVAIGSGSSQGQGMRSIGLWGPLQIPEGGSACSRG